MIHPTNLFGSSSIASSIILMFSLLSTRCCNNPSVAFIAISMFICLIDSIASDSAWDIRSLAIF